ncbi:MAG: hypothetical protein IPM74_10560 [Crocinitomicaceae bacterium]|nr:hypothetical protein [Crocinitomicaceae bacterium]
MKSISTSLLLSVCLLTCSISKAQYKNSLDFDGINDYVNLNVLQNDFYANQTHFTIEFWMKALKDDQTSSIRTVMFAINEPAGENRLLIIMGGPSAQDGKLMIYPDGSWGTGAIYTSSQVIGDNVCHHIAYTYDDGFCSVYIDGILVNTHSAVCSISATDRYSLGQEYDNLATSQFYNGELDDVRIWATVRTAAEIADNMDEELSGTESGLIAYYDFNQGNPLNPNPGLDTLVDLTNGSHTGSLYNFALNNASSNWVRGLCVDPFVGVYDMDITGDKSEIFVYPNPTDNFVYIVIPPLDINNTCCVEIYSLEGKLLISKSLEDIFLTV